MAISSKYARKSSKPALLAAAALAAIAPAVAEAAIVVKENNADNLNLGTSWVGGLAPGAADVATWNASVTGANSTLLGADTSWLGIAIVDPGGAVTIGGANTLTLGTSGINLGAATQDLTIGTNLSLGAGNQVWNVASGRLLTLNTGAFSRSPGSTLNIQGSGTVAASLTGLANVNSILGPWATVGTGANTRYATLSAGNIVGFTGGTASANLGWTSSNNNTFNYDVAATGAVLGVSRVANTVRYTGAAGTQNWGNANTTTITLNGLLNVGTGTLTFAEAGGTSQGELRIGTNNGNELDLSAANAAIVINIPIINAGSVVITGPNAVTINSTGGASTYTGGTTVNGGTLALGAGGTLGTIRGGLTINPGGTVQLTGADGLGFGAGTSVTQVNINGGTLNNATNGNNGYLASWVLTGGSMTSTGGGNFHIIGGTGSITSNASTTTSTISGGVAIRNANTILSINVADGAAESDLLMSGGILNSPFEAGNNGITKSGAGKLVLSGTNTYLGSTTVSNGTLQIGNGGTTGSLNSNSNITNNAALVYNRSDSFSAGNTMSGSGSLTKLGAGALTLTGATTHTGATSVATGTLSFSTSASSVGTLGVADNANLGVKAASAGSTLLTLTGLTFGTSGLTFDFNNLNTTSPLITSTGAVTANGVVTVSTANAALLSSGLHTLISSTGLTGSFTLASPSLGTRATGALVTTATDLSLNVSNDALVWTGIGNNLWTTAATEDNTGPNSWALKAGQTPTSFWLNDVVEFNDTYNLGAGAVAVAVSSISVGSNVNPTSVTFNNSAVNYTISSGSFGITGSGTLTKNGTGTVVIAAQNSYTGSTVINAGTLEIGDGTTDGDINSSTSVTNDGTLVYNRTAGSFTYNNIISGSGSVVKTGAGTQMLGGANTYGGGTAINGGTLQVTTTAGSANSGVFNVNGATLQFNLGVGNNFNYAPTINVSGAAVLGNAAAGNVGTTAGQINYTGTLTGDNVNALTVNNSALARLYMNGTVSQVPAINVTAGAMGFDLAGGNRGGGAPVNVSSGGALWFANAINALANNVTLNGGAGIGSLGALYQEGGGTPTISGSIALASGNSSIGGSTAGAIVTVNGSISGTGGLTKIGANTYLLASNNTYSGGTALSAGTLAITSDASLGTAPGSPATNLTFSGNSTLAATGSIALDVNRNILISSGATATFNPGGASNVLTINGAVSNQSSTGNFVLVTNAINTAAATGTAVLNGSNSFAGGSTISIGGGTNTGGGILRLANSNALGSNAVTLSAAGGNSNWVGAVELSGNVAIGSNVTLNISGHNQGGTGADNLRNASGSNTFGGAIRIVGTGGGYQLNAADPDGTLTVNSFENTLNSARTLNLIGAGNGLIGGAMSDTGGVSSATSVAKSGTGTWTLSSASIGYTGTTAVSDGRLLMNGTQTGAAAYTVNGTGTLGGAGTIGTAAANGVTVAAGGKLAPGASLGTLTMNLGTSGTLDLAGAVTSANSQALQFELDTAATSDKVIVTNSGSTTALNIGSGVLELDDFIFTATSNIAIGEYTLFDSNAAITGTLGANVAGAFANGIVGNLQFGDNGNDLVLSVTGVPEPTSLGIIAMGGMALLRRWRRSK